MSHVKYFILTVSILRIVCVDAGLLKDLLDPATEDIHKFNLNVENTLNTGVNKAVKELDSIFTGNKKDNSKDKKPEDVKPSEVATTNAESEVKTTIETTYTTVKETSNIGLVASDETKNTEITELIDIKPTTESKMMGDDGDVYVNADELRVLEDAANGFDKALQQSNGAWKDIPELQFRTTFDGRMCPVGFLRGFNGFCQEIEE